MNLSLPSCIRVCENLPWVSLDKKCCDVGCWYCMDLCHNCFKPPKVGYTKKEGNLVCKHCSERCRSLHFGDLSEVPAQADLVYFKVKRPLMDVLLLQVTQVASIEPGTNTILSIQLCLSYNHPRIPNDAPYALVQMRTTSKCILSSFFVSPDLTPGDPLWYNKNLDVIDDIRRSGCVQEVLQLALRKNNISDLPSLMAIFYENYKIS